MNARILQAAAIAFAVSMVASPAGAGVSGIRAVQLDPAVGLPGFVTNDVLIDFDGNFRGQQMILELTEGSIFQHDLGGTTAPSQFLLDSEPNARFDSFITVGGLTEADSAPLLIPGGAVNLKSGSKLLEFDSQKINAAWTSASGINIPSGSDFLTSRLTLSENARGTLRYFGSTSMGTGDPWIGQATIDGGVIGSFLRTLPPTAPPVPPPTEPIAPNPPPVIVDPLPVLPDPPPVNPDPLPPPSPRGITGVSVAHRQHAGALSGFVTNDIALNFNETLGGQQMILELTQGSIFQHELGGYTAPHQGIIDVAAEAAFDTFVTVGGATAADSTNVLVPGGAVNLDGPPKLTFDSQKINIAWAPGPGERIASGSDFLTSRITLSDDAQGTLRYFGSTFGNTEWLGEASILDGMIGPLTKVEPIGSPPTNPPAPADPPAPIDTVPEIPPSTSPEPVVPDPVVPEPGVIVIEPSPIEPEPIIFPIIRVPTEPGVDQPIVWKPEVWIDRPFIWVTDDILEALESAEIDFDLYYALPAFGVTGHSLYLRSTENIDSRTMRAFTLGDYVDVASLAVQTHSTSLGFLAAAEAHAGVPEPASVTLGALALVAWLGLVRRRCVPAR